MPALNWWRVFAALVARAPRTTPWLPLLGGAAIGLIVAAIPALSSASISPANHVTLLRIAAVAVALGATFALDDPAAAITVTVPAPRLVRYAARVAPIWVAAGVAWLASVIVTALGADPATRSAIPFGGVTMEAATLVATSFALAGAVRAFGIAMPGIFAGPALLVVVALAAFAPGVFVTPDSPRWSAVHDVWAAVLTGCVAVFVLAGSERLVTNRAQVRS